MAARYRTSVRIFVDVFGEYDAATEDDATAAAIADALESVRVEPHTSSVHDAEWYEGSEDGGLPPRAFRVVSELDS